MAKIIIVNRYFHPDLSATSQMASDLAFSLADSGMQVSVVTSRLSYEDPHADLPDHEALHGVDIRRVWTSRFGRKNLAGRSIDYATFYLSALFRLLVITKAGDVIVAKTDPPLISVVAWIAARIRRARLVNWLQDIFPEVAVSLGVLNWNPVVRLARWLRNRSLRRAHMNVAIGDNMRRRLLDLGIDSRTITVIHNWSDADRITPVDRDSNDLRNEWGLQDNFVVGYSGNMGRAHDFDTIIDAMMRLREERHIVFLFIGGGAGKAKLEAAFRENGIRNYQFRPYQEQAALSRSLSAADVHLVSLQPQLEGLIVPSKIYGIMAAARPFIFVGDPDGEIARLASHTGSGICLGQGEGGKMADNIRQFSGNPDMMLHMGRNGRLALEKYYSKTCATKHWRALLKPVITS